MRQGLDAATLALLQSQRYRDHWRFWCTNGSGSKVYIPVMRLVSVDMTHPSADAPIGSLSVGLLREIASDGSDSVAPTITASSLNRLDDGVTYSPLIDLTRPVGAEVQLAAPTAPRPPDGNGLWYEVFTGNVAGLSWPQYARPATAVVRCVERTGLLQRVKTETARVYPAGTSYEALMRQVLDDNGFAWMPLWVPAPTGKVLEEAYKVPIQKTIWEVVWGIAQSITWVCWQRYRDTDGVACLALFDPPRNKSTYDLQLLNPQEIPDVGFDDENVRNVGYGQFSDGSGARRMVGPVVDGASISKYGNIRRPFWISFRPDSPVRSSADALAVINDAMLDVSDPDVQKSLVVPANPFLECSVDRYAVPATLPLGEAQAVAPHTATMSAKPNEFSGTTTIGARERPSAGYRTWRRLLASVNHEIVSATPTVDAAQGVLTLTVDLPPAPSVVRYRVFSKLGGSPLDTNGDPNPMYFKGPSTEGTETNQVAWAVQDGEHNIVVRAYAPGGAFSQVEVTEVVEGLGSGPGSGGSPGQPDTYPGSPLLARADGFAGTSATLEAGWWNTGSNYSEWHTDVEWFVDGLSFVIDVMDPSDELLVSIQRTFSPGQLVFCRTRYSNHAVLPILSGPWSAHSNPIIAGDT